MSGAEHPGLSHLFVIRYSLIVNRNSLIVMVPEPGIWRGERTDEICYAYMKALA